MDFPCNRFALRAPGNAEEINSLCKPRFDAKLTRFPEIRVNGRDANPLQVI